MHHADPARVSESFRIVNSSRESKDVPCYRSASMLEVMASLQVTFRAVVVHPSILSRFSGKVTPKAGESSWSLGP